MGELDQEVLWWLQQLGAGVLGLGALVLICLAAHILDKVLYPPRPKK